MRTACSIAIAAALLFSLGACKKRVPAAAPGSAAATGSPKTVIVIKPEILAPFEKVLDGALTAYNAGDVTSFDSYFAKNARPPADEHTFQAIFDGIYQPELGNYVARRNLAVESVPDPNYGQIVDVAEFAKHTHVKVTANFQREDGAWKIVQLRFEKM